MEETISSIKQEEIICSAACLNLHTYLGEYYLPNGLVIDEYNGFFSFNISGFKHKKFDTLSISYPPLENISLYRKCWSGSGYRNSYFFKRNVNLY